MEVITLILIVFLYILKLIIPKYKGQLGEKIAKKELEKLNKDYLILNDIMVYSDNKTHQIDHIVISKFGIFVIEMKNYGGKIFGKENDKIWTQKIGRKTNKLNNPIIQNNGHILALKDITKEKKDIFISIVCFGNNVELNIDNCKNVIKLDKLNKIIKSYKEIKLNNIEKIYNQIKELNITSKKERKNHIKNIKKKYE